MKLFKKIAIVGVGLIGGSLGLAIKKKKLADQVVGFFRHKNKISQAIKLKAVDAGTNDFALAVQDSDFIILCSPVSDIVRRLKELKKAKTTALITDIGSTKSEITKASRGLDFIGSHPLAGSEKNGIAFAKADLFKNSLCVLTPGKNPSAYSLEKVNRFWRLLGAKTVVLSPDKHDRILSFASHLPHVAAFALMNTVPKEMLPFAAGGLRDTTRIASSDPKIWNDILLSNNKHLLETIEAFQVSLHKIKIALLKKDAKKLNKLLTQAQRKRSEIKQKP